MRRQMPDGTYKRVNTGGRAAPKNPVRTGARTSRDGIRQARKRTRYPAAQ